MRTRQECERHGDDAEDLFVLTAKHHGWEVEKALPHENLYGGIDYWINRPGDKANRMSVDVKGLKWQERGGPEPLVDWTWLELVGVAGYPGWLCKDSQYLAFGRRYSIIVVPRLEALALVVERVLHPQGLTLPPMRQNELVKPCPPWVSVAEPWQAKYKLFQRHGKGYDRKDWITMVETMELRKRKWVEWDHPGC